MLRRYFSRFLILVVALMGAVFVSGSVRAQMPVCPPVVPCSSVKAAPWWGWADFSPAQKAYFEDEWYGELFLGELWDEYVLPAVQNVANQLSSIDTYLTGARGGFLDAQSSIEAQLAQQNLEAEAVKNYTPGENLCRFGTNVRALAMAQNKAELTQVALARIAQDRQLGTRGGSSDTGAAMDLQSRFLQYQKTYCDPADNGGESQALCGRPHFDSPPARLNKDINYTRTIDSRRTLNLNFDDGVMTEDEEDVMALSNNLYGHEVFGRFGDMFFANAAGNADNKVAYLDLRQIVAWRNVANASFNAQVAARSAGGKGGAQFMRNALREMGMSDKEAREYLDADTNAPSLDAQMDILTKKLYQNPNFYVNLVDKPANVNRQIAAMQAFSLMQDRDLYQTLERQEMLLSVLLEIRTAREQRDVERRLMGLGN